VVAGEKIEVSDDEIMEALRQASTQPGQPEPSDKALRRSLKKARERGQDDALREDIAMRKAVDLIVGAAKPIPAAQAEAREEIWTPEEDKPEQKEIWTPDG
jgi:trigger factor